MFIIFINELVEILELHGIRVKFFADDSKMYAKIVDGFDVERLQAALDALTQWADKWQMSISISIEKCCVLHIGKVCVDTHFHINNNVLPTVNQCLDLGVTISSNLQPSKHINIIVAKAHQCANAILRCFVSRDTNLLIRAFDVYVRPLVESNSVTWSPYLKQDIEAIERVQRCFTKRLPGLHKYSYCERLAMLKLPSLELRRLQNDLVWCYKFIFGCVDVQADDFFELRISNIRGQS
jgi:hypothetical protein